MSMTETNVAEWFALPFDKEIVLNAIPRGARTSALRLSVAPTPSNGALRIMGKLHNGKPGSITLVGASESVPLPFSDRTIRIQYIGDTSAVQVQLESYALA
jgi:hypothetical protein